MLTCFIFHRSEIEIFRNKYLKIDNVCKKMFLKKQNVSKTYKLLVNCNMVLLFTSNWIRIGYVQYVKTEYFINEHRSNFIDWNCAIRNWKNVNKKYKRLLDRKKYSNRSNYDTRNSQKENCSLLTIRIKCIKK